MARPIEALIEYFPLNNKRLKVSFGAWDEKERAEKGKFPCFYKMAESQTLYVRTDKREEHLFLAYSFLNGSGFLGRVHYQPKTNYEVEEPNHLEIFPGMGVISKPPTLIYARDLICGMGISFYSEKRQEGSLINLDINPGCVTFFQNVLTSQINQLGDELDSKIVMGLGTYDSDKLKLAKDIQMTISGILEKNKKYFSKLPNMEVSETSEEYFSYFALDIVSGKNLIEKNTFSHEELLKRIDKN